MEKDTPLPRSPGHGADLNRTEPSPRNSESRDSGAVQGQILAGTGPSAEQYGSQRRGAVAFSSGLASAQRRWCQQRGLPADTGPAAPAWVSRPPPCAPGSQSLTIQHVPDGFPFLRSLEFVSLLASEQPLQKSPQAPALPHGTCAEVWWTGGSQTQNQQNFPATETSFHGHVQTRDAACFPGASSSASCPTPSSRWPAQCQRLFFLA